MNRPEASRPNLVFEPVKSEVLKNNPLGDPALRYVPVYLPPLLRRHETLPGDLPAGRIRLDRHEFSELWIRSGQTVPEMVEKLIRENSMPETIVVMPDCMTRYAGSQYVDSAATGTYETYLTGELIDQIDRNFSTLPEAHHRAVAEKSFGWFGALRLGMRHPDRFSAVACNSGDMDFELCYRPNCPNAARILERCNGNITTLFQRWESRLTKKRRESLYCSTSWRWQPATIPTHRSLRRQTCTCHSSHAPAC